MSELGVLLSDTKDIEINKPCNKTKTNVVLDNTSNDNSKKILHITKDENHKEIDTNQLNNKNEDLIVKEEKIKKKDNHQSNTTDINQDNNINDNNQKENIQIQSELNKKDKIKNNETEEINSIKCFPIDTWDNNGKLIINKWIKSLEYRKIDYLINDIENNNIKDNQYSFAVLHTNHGEINIPKHKDKYIYWEICNLKGETFIMFLPKTWKGIIFKQRNIIGFNKYTLKLVFLNGTNKSCIFIHNSNDIINIGSSIHIVECKSIDKGKQCNHLVNKLKSPYCHEHLRKEYFKVSSTTMQLNMNVGLGPVKKQTSHKHKRLARREHIPSFKEYTISSGNDSNIDKHPWYNLPNDKQLSQLLGKRTIGSRYLSYDPLKAQEELNKKEQNKKIPLQYRNTMQNTKSTSEPPKKKQKLTFTSNEEYEKQKRREELLKKISTSRKVIIK